MPSSGQRLFYCDLGSVLKDDPGFSELGLVPWLKSFEIGLAALTFCLRTKMQIKCIHTG